MQRRFLGSILGLFGCPGATSDPLAPGECVEFAPPSHDPACRDDQRLSTELACSDALFHELDAPESDTFQSSVVSTYGEPLDDRVEPDIWLGFFVSERLLVSAVHVWQGCLEATTIRDEYLAGRDGDPIDCNNGFELLYAGTAARWLPNQLSYTCPADCPPPTSDTSSCYDCAEFDALGDIVVLRANRPLEVPPFVLEIADQIPEPGSIVTHVGKPELAPLVDYDERRLSFGTLETSEGTGILTSAYLYPGFSGGAMLDACGKVFGVSTTRVGDLRIPVDPDWELTYGIGVSLVALRSTLDAVFAYDEANPPPS